MGIGPITGSLYNRAQLARIPLSGTFELTPTCNFACRMCYVRKTAEEVRNSPRGASTVEDWLTIAESARDQGMLYLLLTGGEPTSWPYFWELYDQLADMGLLLNVNTNGSLLNDAAICKLVDRAPKQVNITLYGATDETYLKLCGVQNVCSRVKQNICNLLQAGINVKLNCSLTPYNLGDLEEIVAFSKEHDLELDVATYMFPPLRRDESMIGSNDRFSPEEAAEYRVKTARLLCSDEVYHGFLQKLREGIAPPPELDESCVDPLDGQIRCRAGKAAFWVTWDGWMTPCGVMTEPVVDVRKLGFSRAWTEIIRAADSIKLSGVCNQCGNVQVCHACAAMALTETGSFSGVPTYLCRTAQAMKEIAERELSEGCKQ